MAAIPPGTWHGKAMVTVRPRDDGDLADCVSLLHDVHDEDGYPLHLPDDPVSFLAVPDALGAWVALADGVVVGHVLLRPAANPKMMAIASRATGLPEARLAVVGRLFVAPSARRRGAGHALLRRAATEALELGRRPVLDVVSHRAQAATALYESEGWRKAGTVQVTFRSGETVDELVYVGPAGGPARRVVG